ncbi:hypothetical protein PoB_001662100 [Plakobranchus ocellatus]|uniref:Uncharacterized protein n=1 Tax=Plakobranchus ocellatus TaxID=259542 RepID=A0AAV3Z693_9GAST|nr:hypothetical protein PoB_001662100 [Plakobranchus ocellatus]
MSRQTRIVALDEMYDVRRQKQNTSDNSKVEHVKSKGLIPKEEKSTALFYLQDHDILQMLLSFEVGAEMEPVETNAIASDEEIVEGQNSLEEHLRPSNEKMRPYPRFCFDELNPNGTAYKNFTELSTRNFILVIKPKRRRIFQRQSYSIEISSYDSGMNFQKMILAAQTLDSCGLGEFRFRKGGYAVHESNGSHCPQLLLTSRWKGAALTWTPPFCGCVHFSVMVVGNRPEAESGEILEQTACVSLKRDRARYIEAVCHVRYRYSIPEITSDPSFIARHYLKPSVMDFRGLKSKVSKRIDSLGKCCSKHCLQWMTKRFVKSTLQRFKVGDINDGTRHNISCFLVWDGPKIVKIDAVNHKNNSNFLLLLHTILKKTVLSERRVLMAAWAAQPGKNYRDVDVFDILFPVEFNTTLEPVSTELANTILNQSSASNFISYGRPFSETFHKAIGLAPISEKEPSFRDACNTPMDLVLSGRKNLRRQTTPWHVLDVMRYKSSEGSLRESGNYTVAIYTQRDKPGFIQYQITLTPSGNCGIGYLVFDQRHYDLKRPQDESCSTVLISKPWGTLKRSLGLYWVPPACGCVQFRTLIIVNSSSYEVDDDGISGGKFTVTSCLRPRFRHTRDDFGQLFCKVIERHNIHEVVSSPTFLERHSLTWRGMDRSAVEAEVKIKHYRMKQCCAHSVTGYLHQSCVTQEHKRRIMDFCRQARPIDRVLPFTLQRREYMEVKWHTCCSAKSEEEMHTCFEEHSYEDLGERARVMDFSLDETHPYNDLQDYIMTQEDFDIWDTFTELDTDVTMKSQARAEDHSTDENDFGEEIDDSKQKHGGQVFMYSLPNGDIFVATGSTPASAKSLLNSMRERATRLSKIQPGRLEVLAYTAPCKQPMEMLEPYTKEKSTGTFRLNIVPMGKDKPYRVEIRSKSQSARFVRAMIYMEMHPVCGNGGISYKQSDYYPGRKGAMCVVYITRRSDRKFVSPLFRWMPLSCGCLQFRADDVPCLSRHAKSCEGPVMYPASAGMLSHVRG